MPNPARSRIRLSVVVPAYNEEKRIGKCASRVTAYFRKKCRPFEVVIVNDGSRDGTAREALKAARRYREVKLVSYRENGGKGHALRRGIQASRGDRVLFMDADLSTVPEEWPKLARLLDAGADLAIGSRKTAGARLVQRQPKWRESMGKVFTWLVRRMLVDVTDVTCGFKAFRGPVARELFSRQVLDDWSFDAEVLYMARQAGFRIAEAPVVWKNNPDSKVKIVRATLSALAGIFRVRWFHLTGRYGRLADLNRG
jgi:dolichyl-phosphate beta-glucosyltransferase